MYWKELLLKLIPEDDNAGMAENEIQAYEYSLKSQIRYSGSCMYPHGT